MDTARSETQLRLAELVEPLSRPTVGRFWSESGDHGESRAGSRLAGCISWTLDKVRLIVASAGDSAVARRGTHTVGISPRQTIFHVAPTLWTTSRRVGGGGNSSPTNGQARGKLPRGKADLGSNPVLASSCSRIS